MKIQLVTFLLDGRRYGLHLAAVERVVRAVEVTPLPSGPDIVLGLVNVKGRIVPALDVRRRFRLPARETALEDQLIIARTARRVCALPVDSTGGVVEVDEEDVTKAEGLVAGLGYVEGVVRLEDGMLLIHDLARFLTLDEERALDEAESGAP